MKTFSITDAGAIREMNQDFYFSSDTAVGNLPNLFIVADGMGGHKAGDYASRYTIERVVASVSRNAGDEPVSIIKEAINKANVKPYDFHPVGDTTSTLTDEQHKENVRKCILWPI